MGGGGRYQGLRVNVTIEVAEKQEGGRPSGKKVRMKKGRAEEEAWVIGRVIRVGVGRAPGIETPSEFKTKENGRERPDHKKKRGKQQKMNELNQTPKAIR